MNLKTKISITLIALSMSVLLTSCVEQRATIEFEELRQLPRDLNLSNEDLVAIANLVGSASIVALGESTHGTFEETHVRAQIAKYLISEKQFTIFAIEDQIASAQNIDQQMESSDFDAESALLTLYFWPWKNLELARLLDWMHGRKMELASRLTFTGFDTQNPFEGALELNPLIKESTGLSYTTEPDGWNKILKIEGSSNYIEDSDTILDFVDSLEVDPKFKLYALAAHSYFLQQSRPQDRDVSMAKVIQRIHELHPTEKILLWGHSVHLSKSSSLPPNTDFPSLGRVLSQEVGDDYFTLGFSIGSGSYRAYNPEIQRQDANPMPSPPQKSLEGFLSERYSTPYLLTPKGEVDLSLLHWLPGSVSNDEAFYDRNIPEDYDAIIWLPEAQASDLIDPKKEK